MAEGATRRTTAWVAQRPDAALDAISDVAAGQEALDMKIGALNERMARLEGSLGPARQALSKKQALLQKRLVSDEKTAEAVAEIRKHLLANLPRVVDLFRSFDKNGDGLVSQREFRLVLPMLNLGKSYGSAEMDAVFGALDRDSSASSTSRRCRRCCVRAPT